MTRIAVRAWLVFLLVPACAYLALCAFLYFGQRSQIYFPVRESDPPGATAIRLAGDGVELKVWALARSGPEALVYFGGNAEDVAENLAPFAAAFPDHSLYLVNYRGYGGSGGEPSEQGLFADARAIFDQLRARHPEISVIGRSLGSGVAARLASEREVRRLVLVSPFDSLVNVARKHFPYFPVRLMLRDRYDSLSRVPAIRARTLIVIAGADEIIPRARSDALLAAFPASQVEVMVLEGATHNDPMPQYLERAARFLAQ
ncbi:MAG: alpha/beta hydrolase [Steroidobacteraceae bacterium]